MGAVCVQSKADKRRLRINTHVAFGCAEDNIRSGLHLHLFIPWCAVII